MVALSDEGVNTLIAEIENIIDVSGESNRIFVTGDSDDTVVINHGAEVSEDIEFDGINYTQYSWDDTHLYVEENINIDFTM